MQRAKSYSKNGMNLDVNLHSATKPKNSQDLSKVLKSKSIVMMLRNKNYSQTSHPRKKQQIYCSVPRDTLSSFQKCHTKVQNVNAIYNKKVELTKKSNQYYSMKKYNPPSYFETLGELYKKQHEKTDPCEKLTKTLDSLKWTQPQKTCQTQKRRFHSLHSTSQSKLLIPFEKQTLRPFYQKLQKMQAQERLKPLQPDTYNLHRQESENKKKVGRIHAFQSYSRHQLLNPQKIRKSGSQLTTQDVDPRKYKLKNIAANLKFDKFVNKILTRYDRDCEPWLTKLQYDPKEEILNTSKKIRDFRCQTERRLNQIHSKYPIRLAM